MVARWRKNRTRAAMTCLNPEGFQAVVDGMEGEGEQVHGGEGFGQVFLSMAEVVFEVVAVVFQHVEAFVLDLPSGAGAGDLDPLVPNQIQSIIEVC